MKDKTRKALLSIWKKDRVDAFLEAERRGFVKEVAGGWIIDGQFMEKMPFKGELLTSYLEMLAHREIIGGPDGSPGFTDHDVEVLPVKKDISEATGFWRSCTCFHAPEQHYQGECLARNMSGEQCACQMKGKET